MAAVAVRFLFRSRLRQCADCDVAGALVSDDANDEHPASDLVQHRDCGRRAVAAGGFGLGCCRRRHFPVRHNTADVAGHPLGRRNRGTRPDVGDGLANPEASKYTICYGRAVRHAGRGIHGRNGSWAAGTGCPNTLLKPCLPTFFALWSETRGRCSTMPTCSQLNRSILSVFLFHANHLSMSRLRATKSALPGTRHGSGEMRAL